MVFLKNILHNARVRKKQDLKLPKVFIQLILPKKDPDSLTAYQHAASAFSPNAHNLDSEAPLFLIDRTGAPPPNPAKLVQEQHCEKKTSTIS